MSFLSTRRRMDCLHRSPSTLKEHLARPYCPQSEVCLCRNAIWQVQYSRPSNGTGYLDGNSRATIGSMSVWSRPKCYRAWHHLLARLLWEHLSIIVPWEPSTFPSLYHKSHPPLLYFTKACEGVYIKPWFLLVLPASPPMSGACVPGGPCYIQIGTAGSCSV